MEKEENKIPRFIADAMLGKLARWLRALGYDTLYINGDDHYIAAQARAEQRILLTRDTEFAKRKGLKVLLIESQQLENQLNQVVDAFKLKAKTMQPRCMKCNGVLHDISVEQARPMVPKYVAKTQHRFTQCNSCGQVYWRGTHWEDIQQIRQLV